MRKFLISSATAFAGEIEVLYDATGKLVKFDVSQTNLVPALVRLFKEKVPVDVRELGSAFRDTVSIIEADFEITFDVFYKDYPHKRNRYKAEKVWEKMPKTERIKAYYGLSAYKSYLTKQSWISPMIADRYLRDREYETEWNKL